MKQIAVRLTALLLALVMTTTLALAANKSGYSDVPDKHWAAESIAQCKQYNLLQGIGNGKFGLGQKMTRAAYAAALCRLMGWKTVTPEKGSFTDNQDTKKWYFSAIETASGLKKGNPNSCKYAVLLKVRAHRMHCATKYTNRQNCAMLGIGA